MHLTKKFSIITPCYNMLQPLKACVASVADQSVDIEHIIMDGGSKDGTPEWLKQQHRLVWVSEKDKGMYDALNRGLDKSSGSLIAHLNADEQYLPGTLSYVQKYFNAHPDVDFVVGDFIVVNEQGSFIAYRKSFYPFWPFYFSNYLYNFTCTLFYRKRVLEKLRYDSTLRSIADVDFMFRMLKEGFKGAHLSRFMATFSHTGNNLSLQPISLLENKQYQATRLPKWFMITKPLFKLAFQFTRVLNGNLHFKGHLKYAIYTNEFQTERQQFLVNKPRWKWI